MVTNLTMKKFSNFLSSPFVLVLSAILVAGIFFYFGSAGNPAPQGAPGIFALQLAFNPENFLHVLNSWGEGVQIFVNSMWLDFIFPLAYAFLFSGLLAFFLKEKSAGKTNLIVFLPFAAALLDYLENILHLVIVSNLPNKLGLVLPASLAALIKWVLLFLVILLLIWLMIKRVFLKKRK